MEHKEDIGKLLKEKLGTMEKSPTDTMWGKIESSLDKRDRKRRGMLWLWTIGGAVTLLMILLYLNGLSTPGDQEDPNEIKSSTSVISNPEGSPESEELSSENGLTYNQIKSMHDSLDLVMKQRIDSVIAAEGLLESLPKDNHNFNWEKEANKSTLETGEYISVKTTYQYYNSETGELIETSDKQLIDSLINATGIEVDSLHPVPLKQALKKKDSL